MMAPNAATGVGRKAASAGKDKRRRQKDVERVEKLRLLVSLTGHQKATNGAETSRTSTITTTTTATTTTTTTGLVANRTSTWTNPQSLAAWIDNEVNSLVNDLEITKSQLLAKEKHKSNSGTGKRKWLSAGLGRRDSSGSHSA